MKELGAPSLVKTVKRILVGAVVTAIVALGGYSYLYFAGFVGDEEHKDAVKERREVSAERAEFEKFKVDLDENIAKQLERIHDPDPKARTDAGQQLCGMVHDAYDMLNSPMSEGPKPETLRMPITGKVKKEGEKIEPDEVLPRCTEILDAIGACITKDDNWEVRSNVADALYLGIRDAMPPEHKAVLVSTLRVALLQRDSQEGEGDCYDALVRGYAGLIVASMEDRGTPLLRDVEDAYMKHETPQELDDLGTALGKIQAYLSESDREASMQRIGQG